MGGKEPVGILHFRESREVLEAARLLCHCDNPRELRLGADILGQLGVPERTFPAECFSMLAEMLGKESDPEVLGAIGVAFRHLRDPRVIELLIPLKNPPSPEVRDGVAFGLLGHENVSAIAALIELTNDVDDDVRDWATFGIGTGIEADTPEIRDALYARTSDTHDDTKGEALAGLARRKDPRVLEPLIRELSSESVGLLAVEAAETIGDPCLYPVLVSLKSWWATDGKDAELLEAALAKCSPERTF